MNKSIKFDEANFNTDEVSFAKISLPPVVNITKQSVKSSKFISHTKKLSESNSRLPELFMKS